MQNNFGLSSEAGVPRANLSRVAFDVGILSRVNKHNDVILQGSASGNQRTPCPFIAWIKNCPEFKYLMFFLISHSWNVSLWHGLWPMCGVPSSPSTRQGLTLGLLQPKHAPVIFAPLGHLPRVFCYALFSFLGCSKRLSFHHMINFLHISQHMVWFVLWPWWRWQLRGSGAGAKEESSYRMSCAAGANLWPFKNEAQTDPLWVSGLPLSFLLCFLSSTPVSSFPGLWYIVFSNPWKASWGFFILFNHPVWRALFYGKRAYISDICPPVPKKL